MPYIWGMSNQQAKETKTLTKAEMAEKAAILANSGMLTAIRDIFMNFEAKKAEEAKKSEEADESGSIE